MGTKGISFFVPQRNQKKTRLRVDLKYVYTLYEYVFVSKKAIFFSPMTTEYLFCFRGSFATYFHLTESCLLSDVVSIKQSRNSGNFLLKGTGHFFETLSVGSVPGTDHS